MGTNFYLKRVGKEDLHIGKSSGGWCFALRVYPERGIRDLPDWCMAWSSFFSHIEDEYGQRWTPDAMLEIITKRKWDRKVVPDGGWDKFHEDNYSEDGPNGLSRCKIGEYCIGHGSGTWDLYNRDFS